jgi:hypothetical protein
MLFVEPQALIPTAREIADALRAAQSVEYHLDHVPMNLPAAQALRPFLVRIRDMDAPEAVRRRVHEALVRLAEVG